MFFDPSYQSEYKQHYDESAKQNVEKFLREQNRQQSQEGLMAQNAYKEGQN